MTGTASNMATFNENLPGAHEIEIFVRTEIGTQLTFKTGANTTILELKQKISDARGIPFHRILLMFAGKPLASYIGSTLTPSTLSNYNIQKESTIHMVPRRPPSEEDIVSFPTPANAVECRSKREAEAIAGDFDEDLHIVDPHSHFELLKKLECDVVQRSEYFKTKRTYTLSTILEPKDDDGAVLDEFGFPSLSQSKIQLSSTYLKVHAVFNYTFANRRCWIGWEIRIEGCTYSLTLKRHSRTRTSIKCSGIYSKLIQPSKTFPKAYNKWPACGFVPTRSVL